MTPTYEYYKNVPTRFMSKFARYEPVVLSSTSWKEYEDCPRKYFFSIVLGFKGKTWHPPFVWGIAYHKFREVLSKVYGYGDNTPPKFDEDKARQAYKDAYMEGMEYWIKNSHSTVGTKWDFMTVERLSNSFLYAFKYWKDERQRGNIKVLEVEQILIVQLPDGSYTSARIDELIEWNYRIWGRDFKTTSWSLDMYDRGLNPNDQFTRQSYIESKIVGKPVDGVVVEPLFNAKPTKKDTKGPIIQRFLANRTDWEMEQWEKDEIQDRKTLKMYREEDNYPQRETHCFRCHFRSVCCRPSEQSQMAQLEQLFEIKHYDNVTSEDEE